METRRGFLGQSDLYFFLFSSFLFKTASLPTARFPAFTLILPWPAWIPVSLRKARAPQAIAPAASL